jgi:hypothetical protein
MKIKELDKTRRNVLKRVGAVGPISISGNAILKNNKEIQNTQDDSKARLAEVAVRHEVDIPDEEAIYYPIIQRCDWLDYR